MVGFALDLPQFTPITIIRDHTHTFLLHPTTAWDYERTVRHPTRTLITRDPSCRRQVSFTLSHFRENPFECSLPDVIYCCVNPILILEMNFYLCHISSESNGALSTRQPKMIPSFSISLVNFHSLTRKWPIFVYNEDFSRAQFFTRALWW